MIEIWKIIHLISDNNCNFVNLQCPSFSQGMINNVKFTFSAGDTTWPVYN